MMNPLHLLWIVPLSACIGAFAMAIIAVGDCDPLWYDDDQMRIRDTI